MLKRLAMVLVLLSAALCVSPRPAGAEAGPDSLWVKAVALYEANDDWVPGLIHMHMQEVDKHGQPKDDKGQEVWTRLRLGDDGEVEAEVVKILDDGEDVTEKEKAKEEKKETEQGDDEEDGEGDGFTMEGYAPFDPEHQEGLDVRATGEEEVVGGRRCAVFEFVDVREREDEDDDDETVTVTGRAWLEVGTGTPFKVEYTTDPLPKRVKKMNTTVFYELDEPGSWRAGSMNVQATGGFLFIKKHFNMDMTFDDYWRMPDGEETDTDGGRTPGER